jgi:hypothetical protein
MEYLSGTSRSYGYRSTSSNTAAFHEEYSAVVESLVSGMHAY